MSISQIVEILQVSLENFGLLEKALHAKLPASGLLHNVLKLGQKVNEKSKISVKIFTDSPRDKWEDDDASFMGVANVKVFKSYKNYKQEGLPQNLVVFHGPKEGSSKDTILSLLSALDWKRQNQFEGVDNHVAPVVLEVAKKLGKVEEHDPICLYYMPIDFGLQILQNERDQKILSSTSLKVGSLNVKDAVMVQDRWPEKREGYLYMLEASIELCSSGGVYILRDDGGTKESWELVSFAVQLPFGSCHALHTEPQHRRKGYGSLTMKVLAENIAKEGKIPLVQIYKTNDNSLSMNEGVGFKYSHDINLIHFTPS